MIRICVVGNSGSGKTHLAKRIARRTGVPHFELDAFNHRAGWVEAPVEEFQDEVRCALADSEKLQGGWVVDGNYRSRIGDVLKPDTCVWLDYPRRVVFPRVLRRTLGRLLLRRVLWNGNREQWQNLLRRDPGSNILLWSWTQHASYRRRYEQLSSESANATWVRLRHPRDAERWLANLPE